MIKTTTLVEYNLKKTTRRRGRRTAILTHKYRCVCLCFWFEISIFVPFTITLIDDAHIKPYMALINKFFTFSFLLFLIASPFLQGRSSLDLFPLFFLYYHFLRLCIFFPLYSILIATIISFLLFFYFWGRGWLFFFGSWIIYSVT